MAIVDFQSLDVAADTGKTARLLLMRPSDQTFWNVQTSTWESMEAAYDDYLTPMTEQVNSAAVGLGWWVAQLPTGIAAGTQINFVVKFDAVVDSPAINDPVAATGTRYFDGTDLLVRASTASNTIGYDAPVYLGDYPLAQPNDGIYVTFASKDVTGVPRTLSGAEIRVRNVRTTEWLQGAADSLFVNYDVSGDVGVNQAGIDFVDNPDVIRAGEDYAIDQIGGTLSGGTLQAGPITLAYFSVQARYSTVSEAQAAHLDADVSSRLAPTTAGRTLDVSATGEAGIDLANVGSPTTTLDLSGVTVGTVTDLTNAAPSTDATLTLIKNIVQAQD
jgi:hypothetical protein